MWRDRHPASFRDPSGYIFTENGKTYRRVNPSYFSTFAQCNKTGLYDALIEKGWLIPHELIEKNVEYITLKPEHLSLITYPHEWSFSQIKDAALLTLRIHEIALHSGMVLKDANAFNVQFHQGKPVFIDTLSFAPYNNGDPWGAYGQFCRHFLSPLLLMKYISPDFNKLHISYLDGVPLDIASNMLPAKTHFSPFIKTNIHMHAKAFNKHKNSFDTDKKPCLPLRAQLNIVQNMIHYISGMSLNTETEWGDYYDITNYDQQGFEFKEATVNELIKKYGLRNIWDIGGNNGHFSRLVQNNCDTIICSDIDPVAVNENYLTAQKNNEQKIIPLIIDYTNPSPGIGFVNEERSSFQHRIKDLQIDCIMALALIHHLSISANCSFEMLAESFSAISENLLIEFVHPEDSWVEKLMQSKREARSLFNFYNRKNFEINFLRYYNILETYEVPNSYRTLYMMKRRRNISSK